LDFRTMVTWLGQMAAGAATYYMTKKALSYAQEDPEKYMRDSVGDLENGEYGKLAVVGFSRSAFSSLLPMLYDTSASFVGAPKIDYRTSGSAGDAMFGNPTVGWFNDMANVSSGVIDSYKNDRELSQQELKAALRSTVGNWIPLQIMFSSMIHDRPLKNSN